ncbi:MAG: aminotransferase class III-fold pyridoxal phosphate-dependent enzyme [Verrucomicrobiales bacterium]|nr:aminotransferase class III-fold pyridoxal phosphate-dependent enzyme [Verrucomicrobiales bacterium]
MSSESQTLRITASFVAEPLGASLEFLLKEAGMPAEVVFSEFNQVFQEALNPASGSALNSDGVNIFLVRPPDLSENEADEKLASELADAIDGLSAKSSARILLVFCPHQNRDAKSDQWERLVRDSLKATGTVTTVLSSEILSGYPVEDGFDSEAESAASVPYSAEMYAALGLVIARNVSRVSRRPAKVIVLDADNTLWGGVAGEDGPSGLDMNGPWREMADFMVAKHDEGFLLALASKNNEKDLDLVFAERAEDLSLRRDHFVGWKVNWKPKSLNLTELAEELNLGIDSFVFIDDNPAEVAEVAANCPGVTALCLPSDPAKIPPFIRNLWCLDSNGATSEDGLRTRFYQSEGDRKELLESSSDFATFLKDLNLEVKITEAAAHDHSRIAQLSQRTNQFNANTLRLSESDLATRCADSGECSIVSVSDRFGQYGLVGAMLYRETGSSLRTDLFILSCRALGKGVERVMMIELARLANELGLETIEVGFEESEKNEPCRAFLSEIGAEFDKTDGVFRIAMAEAAELSPFPKSATKIAPSAKRAKSSQAMSQSGWNDFLIKAASLWSEPKALAADLVKARKVRPEISDDYLKPGTPVQKQIVAIWEEVLEMDGIGISDAFSKLGGGSLDMVRVHSMLRGEFDIKMELSELFALPTVKDIESAIAKESAPGKTASQTIAVNEKRSAEKDDLADQVAIVGMSLRIPGANDTEELWSNLAAGTESISRFEKDELAYPDEFERSDFVPVKGIIEDIDMFDASFFGILPKDAKIMDPQQRIFLELAWEAMEKAGYQPDNHRERIGVYAGAYFDTYLLANLCSDPKFLNELIPQIQVGSLQTELGNDKDYLATRVAFKLNLRGPAMTLQTACSTSMVAIAEACRSIREGLCDMALAGGVTVTLPYKRGYFYTEQGMLSGDGHCRAFDEKASGTVFANGAGVVMLKRLSDAIRDRDHIHAVIRGTGMNNDGGVKHSYTAPSVDGQVSVIRMAHEDAGVSPDTITAIEAHGTGTPMGDPIEVTALTKAFREAGVKGNQYCAIGSLKTNVGHLDVASGVCGVIKTAISLEKKALPPLLHYQKANPKIDFVNSPFFPNAELKEWERISEEIPRRAGVSSFGVGGTNVHTVMEEAPEVNSVKSARDAQLVILSARSEAALNKAVKNLAAYCKVNAEKEQLADAAWTFAIGRKPFRARRVFVAENFAELQKSLAKPGVTETVDRSDPPVNFMFPGQGAQHVNMALAFYRSEPRFRELIDRCSALLEPHLNVSLREVLFPEKGTNLEIAAEVLKNTTLAQPAIFVIEYALADLWMHWGITPKAMVGHSVGEFVAACHAGVFSLEEGLKLLAHRGRLMGDLRGGGMLSVRLDEAALIERLPAELDLAAVNSPGLCVVAGEHRDLEKFAGILEKEGIVAKPLHTSHAFHSRMMDSVIPKFEACFSEVKLQAPAISIFSTVTGDWLAPEEATDPAYWAKHLRETVRFSEAVSRLASEENRQIFVEVGPGQTLCGLARQSLDRGSSHRIVSTCRHIQESGSDHAQMLTSLGRLWMDGVEVDWEAFYGDEVRKRIPLPTYPFERKRHWVDPVGIKTGPESEPTPGPDPTALISQFSNVTTARTDTDMSTTTASRNSAIASAIGEILTNLSGVPEEELIGSSTYLELGFDSLLLTQVSKAFNDEFGTNVKMRELMTDLSTIDSMVAHLDEILPQERYREAVAPAPTAAPAPAIEPAAGVAAVPEQAPVVSMVAPAASSPSITPVPNDGSLQSIIAQQMNLMQQQLGLLQGVPVPGAVAPGAGVELPALTPVQSPGPAESKPVSKEKAADRNVSAPTTSIDREVDETLTPTQQKHLDELIAKYTTKTASSKALTEQYRQWYADPRTVSGFNRLWKEMIYQIVVKKSKGSRLLDIDGNEYIDMLNGFGPGFLGHSPDRITAVLHDQLDRGVEVGPQCQDAMEAAKLFCELTGNERCSFVNTGSEAVQAAMRMTRTVTGRDKIVVFTKDYHGNFDEVLVRGVGSGDKLRSMPVAPGIPNRAVDDVIVLDYGTDESLEIIRKRGKEIAAVIVEPIQSRRPEFQPKEFIQELRAITTECGSAFVFDEVITGFRTGPKGAQEYFGVEADVATYGKVVGAGMPVGVVAGKAEYMDTFDGGHWQYGDDSFPEQGVTFFAGTFVRHPLAMAAVKEMLIYLKECGPELWVELKAKANRLSSTVDKMFVENGVPFRMPNFGSQMFVRHIDDNKYANLLFFHLRQKGVFLLEGFPSYMTTAHTDEDVDYVIAAFRESIAELQDAGFFEKPATGSAVQLNGKRLSGPARLLPWKEESSGEIVEAPGTAKKSQRAVLATP